MTPDQILAGLRDIHLPEMETAAATGNLVLWPLALVLLTGLAVVWLIWRRRSIWHRDVVEGLDQIEKTVDHGNEEEGWAKLALLLKRLAIQRQTRHEIAALSGECWLERLDDLIGTDIFTTGPGRGLMTFPYLARNVDDDATERRREDLKATITTLRKRLSRFGPTG